MKERFPSQESDPMFEAIAALLRDDPQSPEGRELLAQWSEQQDEIAMRENSPRANTEATLRHARLYSAAGLIESARAHFEDVAYEAEQGGYDDLREEAREGLASLPQK